MKLIGAIAVGWVALILLVAGVVCLGHLFGANAP